MYAALYTPEPSRPASGPQPGTLTLQRWIIDNWDATDGVDDTDPTNLGIYNPRDVCGNPWTGPGSWTCAGSQHARGAAGDDGFPRDKHRWPTGHPEGTKLAHWLVAHHHQLGIQEVIWAGHRWTNQTLQWRTYNGRSDHYDHVHWAQTSTAARALTLADITAVAPHPPEEPEENDDMETTFVWLKDDRTPTATVKPVAGAHLYAITHAPVHTTAGPKTVLIGGRAVHQNAGSLAVAQFFAAGAVKPLGSKTKPALGYAAITGIEIVDGPLAGL